MLAGMRLRGWLIFLLILIIGGAALVWAANGNGSSDRSQLTGIKVAKDLADRPVLGIVIENSEQARPQTGLGAAGIVFETVAEGGITRYLALYQENMPTVVGPVRSLRPYFVDWALGFDASVAHVGGSPEALAMADRLDLKNLDQFKHSGPYYRDPARDAPHNVYARTADLRDLQQRLGYGKSNFDTIPRKNDAPSQNPTAPNITINFSGAQFVAEFRYQSSSNTYQRYLAGELHVDKATNQPITVKNVVVMKMSGNDILAIGNGDAFVFLDGQVIQAHWQQSDHNSRVQIVDNNDKEIPLNRGSTWFAVVPKSGSVSY